MRAVFRFLAVVFVALAVSVFGAHAFVLARTPRGIGDAQYGIYLGLAGAGGWAMGIGLFFLFSALKRRSPRAAVVGYQIGLAYAALAIGVSLIIQIIRIQGAAKHAFELVVHLLKLFVLSPAFLMILPMSPQMILLQTAIFLPLLVILFLLFRREWD